MVFEADLLPHDRGGGCDTCDIAETACCDRLHVFCIIIQLSDKIDQSGSDDVRKMADAGCDKIVFLTGKDHRDRTKRIDQFRKLGDFFKRNLSARSQDIVSILKQVVG